MNKNSEHTEKYHYPQLTEKGTADMQAVSGDMNNWFWSSSVVPAFPDSAFKFYGRDGDVVLDGFRVDDSVAVLCVVSR